MTWSCFTSSQVKIRKNYKQDSADTWNEFATHFKLLSHNSYNDTGAARVSVY